MEISRAVVGEPGDACLICHRSLEDETAIRYLIGVQPVLLCGNDCLKIFLEDPELYLATTDPDDENTV